MPTPRETREWWMWIIANGRPDGESESVRVVARKLELAIPYVWDDALVPEKHRGWGVIGVAHDHKRDLAEMRGVFVSYLRQWLPRDFAQRDAELHLMGKMIVAELRDFYRGRREARFTPPCFKFCDLNKEFPEVEESNLVRPFDFWIQPDVYQATGQIMQGSPVYQNIEPGGRRGPHVRALRTMIEERNVRLEAGADAIEWLEWIHVALDAWVENYERTGETTADPRFAFTFAEERKRQFGDRL